MPPERPELPGQAVRLENAERFVAATGGGGRHWRSLGLLRVTVLNISASLLNKNGVSGEGGLIWAQQPCPLFFATNAFS